MKRCVILIVLAGCDPAAGPVIGIDVSPVNIGIRSTSPDLEALHFDLQLFNNGSGELVLESVTISGDASCAFEFSEPDSTTLYEGGAAFIRGWYQPSVAGEDQLVMAVASNSEEHNPLIVPICGLAVVPGTTEAEPVTCDAEIAYEREDCAE